MSQTHPKVILISGTSSGFGLFFAARLAERGHIVYATMRDTSKKQDLEEVVLRRGANVTICAMDVTKTDSIDAVIKNILDKHKRIDVVINNAGAALGGFFEDLDTDQMRQLMETNFWGAVNICRYVTPLMRQQKQGMIINVSSIAGQTASPALSAYNATKWAMEGFSESLYYELKRFGVHVVLVEPGSYPTKIFGSNALVGKRSHDMNSPYFDYSKRLESFVKSFHEKSKRDPEDVARLVENIIHTENPKLRYISDPSSWLRVMTSKIIPPSWYRFIYEKVIYGKTKHTV